MDYNNGKRLSDFKMTIEIKLGDIVRLRKAHPCGSYEWEVVRVGADIGLKCLKCQKKVLLKRGVFERRVKTLVARSN
ncbi:MAG: DUF951 domain-containing protein [Chloroflexota bacterium]